MNRTMDIRKNIETFLDTWDRHVWMQDYGQWASAAWDEAREEYDEARREVSLLPEGAALGASDALAALAALDRLREAIEALDGQVLPDESDYIAEGLIDPDEVAGDTTPLDVSDAWEGWDCREGWSAHRVGDDLYLHWWREAYGNRRPRDLWVLVEAGFFVSVI